jgi:circadian clock protein KaiA
LSAIITVATLIESPALRASLGDVLGDGRYLVKTFIQPADFLRCVEQDEHGIDCLILQATSFTNETVERLYNHGIILPTVFLGQELGAEAPRYHSSEVAVDPTNLAEIDQAIEKSIAKFLNMTPIDPLEKTPDNPLPDHPPEPNIFLLQQQRRLSEKLKERLGYLAVYYKRSPQTFFRNLTHEERESLVIELQGSYRQIVLAYFTPDSKVNDLLDEFVTILFFADLSVSEVVEIHMDLMEEFSKQLKLEGWSEDILLDYRLTLIDVIAHLCEMYRRSIPREES